MNSPHRRTAAGFNLVELLIVLVVVAILAATAMTVFAKARLKASEVNDLSRMRNLGIALHGWAAEHQGRLPRSSHSAIGHGELGWQREILPYLGFADTNRNTLAAAKLEQFGIDPQESPTRSPALNVYFELNPDYDDYEGAPESWRQFLGIPNPSSTILLIAIQGTVDHVMAHYFSGNPPNYPAPRQGSRKGCILWVDGHASLDNAGSVFDSAKGIDQFHPAKAR